MNIVITRTSDDSMYVREFSTLKDLIDFYEQTPGKYDLLFSDNFFFNEPIDDICNSLDIKNRHKAKQISEARYSIEIHDDYRE